jgi:integrase
VNRDLETLKKGFRLASRYGLDVPIPHVPKLRENNVRSGFVTQEELRRIVENLPAYLRPIIQAAAITGWRIGELKSRQWRHVDREAGYLRLEPSESKNGRARSFPLIQPLLDVLPPQTCEWVFNRNGKPVGDFRKAWRTATTRAGCQGVWVHDLRRRGVDLVFWTKTGRS